MKPVIINFSNGRKEKLVPVVKVPIQVAGDVFFVVYFQTLNQWKDKHKKKMVPYFFLITNSIGEYQMQDYEDSDSGVIHFYFDPNINHDKQFIMMQDVIQKESKELDKRIRDNFRYAFQYIHSPNTAPYAKNYKIDKELFKRIPTTYSIIDFFKGIYKVHSLVPLELNTSYLRSISLSHENEAVRQIAKLHMNRLDKFYSALTPFKADEIDMIREGDFIGVVKTMKLSRHTIDFFRNWPRDYRQKMIGLIIDAYERKNKHPLFFGYLLEDESKEEYDKALLILLAHVIEGRNILNYKKTFFASTDAIESGIRNYYNYNKYDYDDALLPFDKMRMSHLKNGDILYKITHIGDIYYRYVKSSNVQYTGKNTVIVYDYDFDKANIFDVIEEGRKQIKIGIERVIKGENVSPSL